MGNSSGTSAADTPSTTTDTRKPRGLTTKDLRCHTYIHTYREGDAELPEDPDFPKRLLDQTRSFDFSNQVEDGSGTYIFYPTKDKPKMWVGQYKCLNPGDLLCNQDCPLDLQTTLAHCGDAVGQLDPTGCGLMQYCMPTPEPFVTDLPGGVAYERPPPSSAYEHNLQQEAVNQEAQQSYALASGNVYAHSNFGQRLAFQQDMHRSNLPCSPPMTRMYQGTVPPTNHPFQLYS